MSTLQGCFYRRRTFSTFSNCQYILIVSGISLDIECQLILMKTVLLSGILDLPAKAQVMEMNQYNGEYSCSYCEVEGKLITTENFGHPRVFPTDSLTLEDPPRTEKSIAQSHKLHKKQLSRANQ